MYGTRTKGAFLVRGPVRGYSGVSLVGHRTRTRTRTPWYLPGYLPQVANFLIFFRDELNGVPLDELIRRKAERAAAEASEPARPTGTAKLGVV